jgi:hypothetical protein
MPPACLSMEIRPRTNAMLSSTGHCLAHRASFPYSSKGITNREAIILLAFRITLCAATILLLHSGCSIEQEISRTPRTAVEQLLLTEAVERALTNLTLTLPAQASLHLEVSGFYIDRARLTMRDSTSGTVQDPTVDFLFVRNTVAVALGRMGYRIRKREDQPAYLVRVSIEALGTMQGLTFVGMPPIQSVIIPFALPELTLYKLQAQSGYARLHLDVFDHLTGEYKGSSATMIGRTQYDQYTAFFYITWIETDMTAPP